MLKEITKPSFQKISSYECRKNWYAGELSKPAPIAKSTVTAATIAKVIRDAQKITADGIDERLQELQKELLKKS